MFVNFWGRGEGKLAGILTVITFNLQVNLGRINI